MQQVKWKTLTIKHEIWPSQMFTIHNTQYTLVERARCEPCLFVVSRSPLPFTVLILVESVRTSVFPEQSALAPLVIWNLLVFERAEEPPCRLSPWHSIIDTRRLLAGKRERSKRREECVDFGRYVPTSANRGETCPTSYSSKYYGLDFL